LLKDLPSEIPLTRGSVDLGEVQVGLVEIGRYSNAFLKCLSRIFQVLGPPIDNSNVVESFRKIWAQSQRGLQELVGSFGVSFLGKEHPKFVVCFWIVWIGSKSLLKPRLRLREAALQPIKGSKTHQCATIVGLLPNRCFEITLRCLRLPPCAAMIPRLISASG